jgi:hypothetical protein
MEELQPEQLLEFNKQSWNTTTDCNKAPNSYLMLIL